MTNTATVTTNYTLLARDTFILADATSGGITITLPSAAAIGASHRFFGIKKIDNTANTVVIAAAAAEFIENAATKILASHLSAAFLYSNGAAWYIMGAV